MTFPRAESAEESQQPPLRLLSARDVTVDFPGVRALDCVSLDVGVGDVVGVVGANGSGKTTLLTVLCGMRQPTHGSLADANGTFTLGSPRDALGRGITFVPSEPQLATTLSCWENLTLGEPARFGITLARDRRRRAEAELRAALPNVHPNTLAGDLKKSDRALLGLLVALRREPHVLALDEPTAVLGEAGVDVVKDAISRVRAGGGAVVLVSHRLRDILQLATKIVVLVDGRVTYQGPAGDLTPAEIVQKLTEGRSEAAIQPRAGQAPSQDGDVVLSLEHLRASTGLHVEQLDVRAGEIVGVAGLAGSGRSRLLRLAAGEVPSHSGAVRFAGGPLPSSPHAARRRAIAYIPEDRIRDAIFPSLSVTANLNAGDLPRARSLLSVVSPARESRRARELIGEYGIRVPGLAALVTTLSSGNQQRVVLARELSRAPRLVVADEPTQGVDSGGRLAIHEMLKTYARQGGAVLMVSSDFEELRDLCHRIVVMRDGELVAEFARGADPQAVLSVATGATLRAIAAATDVTR